LSWKNAKSTKEGAVSVIQFSKSRDDPFACERITADLAPVTLRKDGAGFDLPIAVGKLSLTNFKGD
jgi:predicted ATPase with chaperone activity